MPFWKIEPEWQGQDACIIGGGTSLSKFNFEALRGRNTIGCNDAYRLGPDYVKICLFGDSSWFEANKEGLGKFPNRVVSIASALYQSKIPWLQILERSRTGLHSGHVLGWNFSTGAAAVNLALSLGAIRVFLLGFDMTNDRSKRAHWHPYNDKPVKDLCYRRFITGFAKIQSDLGKLFPDVRVFNVTDGTSLLPYFARISFETFYKYLPPQERKPCISCQEQREAQAKELARA